MAACRRDHPLANRLLMDLALAGVPGRPVCIYEAEHVMTLLGLVEAGLGVAALPQLALPGKDHPILASVLLTDPVVTRRLGLSRRRGRSLSPAAQQLFALVAQLKKRRARSPRDDQKRQTSASTRSTITPDWPR